MAHEEINAVELLTMADVIDIRTNIEGNNIRVVAILNITLDGIFADNVKVLVSAIGDGVFTKYEDINFDTYLGIAEEKFDNSFDVEIVDAIDRVLTVCPVSYIDRVEPYDNYVKLYGGVAVTVTYLTRGERPVIRTYDNTYNFTQEIALTGTMPNSNVVSKISTMYDSLG